MFVADVDRPALDVGDRHHLARVLRVRVGDRLTIGDGRGAWRDAIFTADEPEPVGEVVRVARPSPAIGVGFALVKGQKPELVVQKLTEVGVDDIRPFTAARSVVRWDPGKADAALDRLTRVARSAAMQCRRAWLPEVAPVCSFAEVAASPGAARADRGGRPPALERPLILVGPEGGWAPEELAVDLPVVGLGGPVLRAETAAIVAGALLGALRGGLVAPR
ncbi:MAG: rRNA methyltransferase [Acidimicrobiales bacterium]|nr:rRNA methyltransferase [Acidimicrobiales bacterium]